MARRKHPVPSSAHTPVAAPRDRGTPSSADATAGVPGPVTTSTPDTPAPRRRFVRHLWAWLGVGALTELAWITGTFLRPRQDPAAAAGVFVAGPLDRFEPGSVTAFPAGRFYLVRLKDGGLMALHRECTHLGCTVPWDGSKGRFACPCHASAFDITGQVLNAPAPRPLDFYAVRLENGIVKVDTRRRLQRTAFDASQVTVA